MFPLIQLPRKSEVNLAQLDEESILVSINSTSEEVRSISPKSVKRFELVSINSTSEEVRSFNLVLLPRG